MVRFTRKFTRKKQDYMDWEMYSQLVDAVNLFAWQQRVRRKSLPKAAG